MANIILGSVLIMASAVFSLRPVIDPIFIAPMALVGVVFVVAGMFDRGVQHG